MSLLKCASILVSGTFTIWTVFPGDEVFWYLDSCFGYRQQSSNGHRSQSSEVAPWKERPYGRRLPLRPIEVCSMSHQTESRGLARLGDLFQHRGCPPLEALYHSMAGL